MRKLKAREDKKRSARKLLKEDEDSLRYNPCAVVF